MLTRRRVLLAMGSVLVLAVLAGLGFGAWALSYYQRSLEPPDPTPTPQELMALYHQYEGRYDPRIAGLYLDEARIFYSRIYPGGQVREIELAMEGYRILLVVSTPLAWLTADANEYSDFDFEQSDAVAHVRATRRPRWKTYESPCEWVLHRQADGNWRIAEEHIESRPF
jgi:hypothetical protein